VAERAKLNAGMRLALTPRRWPDVAREALWMARSRPVGPGAPTWPVDAAALRGVKLRWPVAYEWAPARIWTEGLLGAIGRHVRVERSDIPQPYQGIVRFEFAGALVALDYGDSPDLDAACLDDVALYFKMQHRRGGYDDERVIAGGFVPSRQELYPLLGYLRGVRDRRSFAYDVYGRFNIDAPSVAELRRRAVLTLRDQDRVGFYGGVGTVGFGRSLRDSARSRVCLDLPGNSDMCFRLIEHLALGACIVGPRPGTELHVPLVDGEHVAWVADDLSDLVDVCERYVRDDAAREAMAAAARSYFDRYLHRDQLAGYCLDHLVRLR